MTFSGSGAITWDQIGNAAANLTLANAAFTTTFQQTANTIWLWQNTTTATSGTTNASPLLELASNYWTGAASAQDTWSIGSSLAAGTNGVSLLTFAHSGSTGHATLAAPGIGNPGGNLQLVSASSANYGNAFVTDVSATIVASTFSAGGAPGTGVTGIYYGKESVWADGSVYAIGIIGSSHYLGIGSTSVIDFSSTTAFSGSADVGVSRSAIGTLAIGNGTAGNTAGNLSFGTTVKYNGTATVRNGQPAEYASSDLTAQSAAITATTLLSAPQTGAYRVSWSATITTVDLVSSVLGGANGFQVIYTSPTDSVVKTTVTGASVTSAANTTGTATSGVLTIYAKNATNIQFTYGYTSATPGQMIFEIHVSLEAL